MAYRRYYRKVNSKHFHSSSFSWIAQWLDEAFSFFRAGPDPAIHDLDRQYPLTGGPFYEAALKVVMSYNHAETISPDNDVFRAMLRIGLSVLSVAFYRKAKGRDLKKKLLSIFRKEVYTL